MAISILTDPKGLYAEAFRTIKTNIKYSLSNKNKKVLLITSSEAGEGKSTIASNLALSLSQDNKKVVLIDCDLRKPTLNKHFSISGMEGLTEAIIGEKSIEKVTKKINNYLDVIPSGHVPPNPAELLASDEMDKIINELRGKYDYVIIDTSPICLVADAQILSTKSDGVIFVLRNKKTKKDNLCKAKKLVEQVGGNVIGMILNRKEQRKGKYYYYYD